MDAFGLLAREPLLGEAREDLAPELRSFSVGSYLVLYIPRIQGVRIIQVVHAARDIRAAFRGNKGQ